MVSLMWNIHLTLGRYLVISGINLQHCATDNAGPSSANIRLCQGKCARLGLHNRNTHTNKHSFLVSFFFSNNSPHTHYIYVGMASSWFWGLGLNLDPGKEKGYIYTLHLHRVLPKIPNGDYGL